ncbi:hypothetical protein Nepgr_008697 [Nepenthes gracilis]|uniref:Uncharacterized protein n=1 Tax=Nepenthes gracilis TaxID=150966 RepID=A0AAD3S9Y7_NEPGR|nr:hypothetical protein Nepgr_008697 [Nepenthes gracilis]
MKMKLMPSFYRAANQYTSSNTVVPKQPPMSSSVEFIGNKDVSKPMPLTHNVSPVVSEDDQGYRAQDPIGQLGEYFGAIADERVNMMAANYISSVRERFRLDAVNA